jgi:hypothetical protein
MPVRFKILPRRNLVIFTYSGHVTLDESAEAVAVAANHPDHRPGMRQLCDLSAVTSVERDFPALMKTQARIAESLLQKPADVVVMFYAPHRIAKEIVQMARRSWEGLNSVIVLEQDDEAEALSLLGLPEPSVAKLLVSA